MIYHLLAPGSHLVCYLLLKEEFFTGDDGHPVVSSSSQTSSVRILDGLAGIAQYGTLAMHLHVFCDHIKAHKSLSNATIVSASTYAVSIRLQVRHRFLLLRLRRDGKQGVWLRLDRLQSRGSAFAKLTLASGGIEVHDVVRFLRGVD